MVRRLATTCAVLLLATFLAEAARLPSVTVDSSVADVQSEAARIAEAFAGLVAETLELELVPPTVEAWNTPSLAFFDPRSKRIVVPHWHTLDPEQQSFFLGLTQTPSQAAEIFVALFNEFLVAHEMAHWLQWSLGLVRDLYTLEREANDLAAAFFMARDDEESLAELAAMIGAMTPLPNPTPKGVDEASFFNARYADLASDPARYGHYQFRFILESIDRRSDMDFATLLERLESERP